MRTIRHRAMPTITARSGYDDDEGTLNWLVTVPWEDGDESDNHGHPVLAQLTFDVEGPEGDVVEDVTLSAIDTYALYRALREAYDHIERHTPGAVEDALLADRED